MPTCSAKQQVFWITNNAVCRATGMKGSACLYPSRVSLHPEFVYFLPSAFGLSAYCLLVCGEGEEGWTVGVGGMG